MGGMLFYQFLTNFIRLNDKIKSLMIGIPEPQIPNPEPIPQPPVPETVPAPIPQTVPAPIPQTIPEPI